MPRPDGPLLEVCVGSLDDGLAAARGGADRLELCGALELGGLTPSIGLIEQVLGAVSIPVVVMIRPRAGGFDYTAGEFAAMQRDAERALGAGASGIVFGFLRIDRTVDRPRTADLVRIAGGAETVFHRAFDSVADPLASLDQLVDCGVTRILTSGGAPTASEGAGAIASLVARAAGRVGVLPGGGVRPEGVAALLSQTGCDQVHIGAAASGVDATARGQLADLGRLSRGEHRVVDAAIVRAVAAAMRG